MSQNPRVAGHIDVVMPGVLRANMQIVHVANNAPQVIAANGNIALGNPPFGAVTVAPAGAVAGITMDKGFVDQQEVLVHNTSAFTVTFAAVGTSNVADGVADVIPALTVRHYIWLMSQFAWYHVG